MRAYILAHEDAVVRWRCLMGPTRVSRARNTAPDSIRGAYGLTDTRNATHGSGGPPGRPGQSAGGFALRALVVSGDARSSCLPGPTGHLPTLAQVLGLRDTRVALGPPDASSACPRGMQRAVRCNGGTSHLHLPSSLADSAASASKEIAFFFPEFDERRWYQEDEPRLRCGQARYSAEERVHQVPEDEGTESA